MRMVRARMMKRLWKSNTTVVGMSGVLVRMRHGHCEVCGRLSTIPMGYGYRCLYYHNILQRNTSYLLCNRHSLDLKSSMSWMYRRLASRNETAPIGFVAVQRLVLNDSG